MVYYSILKKIAAAGRYGLLFFILGACATPQKVIETNIYISGSNVNLDNLKLEKSSGDTLGAEVDATTDADARLIPGGI